MRGLAAIAVVLHHLGGQLYLNWMVPRGYLAVDFFFMLSGLVIANAYKARLGTTMTFGTFAAQRGLRLYPMIVVGGLLATALALFTFRREHLHPQDLAAAAVLGSAALPVIYQSSLPPAIFPLNGPIWSIFFEFVANGLFAGMARRKDFYRLSFVIAVVSLVGLGYAVGVYDTLSIGSRLTNWGWGFARVGFSFFAGVLLLEYRKRLPHVPPVIAAAMLVAPLMLPMGTSLDGYLDLAFVTFLFPVAIASLSVVQPTGHLTRLSKMSGDLSYPLYAIHYPVCMAVTSVGAIIIRGAAVRTGVAIVVAAGTVAAALWLNRYFDLPVRQYLARRSGRTLKAQ